MYHRIAWFNLLVLIALALSPVAKVRANSFIGVYDGNPLIHFGDADPARPPVVVTGGTQLLILAPQDSWTLAIEAKGDLATTKEPKVTIPASRLAWAIYDSHPPRWTPLEACRPQIVLSQADPTGEGGRAVRIDYRFSPSWEDPPIAGGYSTDLCFTLSPDLDPMQSWVYPTPFFLDGMEVLTIGYWLPGSGPWQVEVVITDTRGEVVRKIRATQLGGQWQQAIWDGFTPDGDLIPPGTYHYQVMLLSTQEPIAAGIIEVAGIKYAGQSTIRGQVSGGDTGKGLAGAQVVLYTRERRQVATCQTRGDGTYQLAFLPAGEYYLEASLPGYVSVSSDTFVLDGYEERDIDLTLLPNRALDIDLRLDSKTVAVGDLLKATLRVTNSGTRDLLEVICEVELPAGFTLMEGTESKGQVHAKSKGGDPGNRVLWEVGPLREGESVEAAIWLLVGLDTPADGALIKAQATGYGSLQKVETQMVAKQVEVAPGPFMATTPRTLVDGHLILPLGPDVLMEVRMEPDKAIAGPGLPFEVTKPEKYIDRSPLVSIADPMPLVLGSSLPHKLRLRLEGSNWAMEGGSWKHSLPQPLQEVSLIGIQGARRLGALILRGFYGTPQAWPSFCLYPANNTSGPFELPSPFPIADSVNVQILSYDPVRGVWHEEPPVLFRVDHVKGAVTLGRAIGAYNPRGQRQYVLVTYSEGPSAKNMAWTEVEAVLEQPGWEVAASYLQAGTRGELRLAGLRSQIVGQGLHLKGSVQTTLASKLSTGLDLDAVLPPVDNVKPSRVYTLRDKSAWQLLAALEMHPGLRVGGGLSQEGSVYTGFWGLTTKGAKKDAAQGKKGLGRLVQNLEEQLTLALPGAKRGQDSLTIPDKRWEAKALGLEFDLASGWTTSLVMHKEELVESKPGTAKPTTGKGTSGWVQRLHFEAAGLPRWSLGYGQLVTNHLSHKGKHHYGFVEVQGKVQAVEWDAKLSLIEENSKDMTSKGKSPIQVVAEVGAAFEKGTMRPHINVRQGASVVDDSRQSLGGFEEWVIGIDSRLTDKLEVSLAHLSKKELESNASNLRKEANTKQASSGKETVSLVARYVLWEDWILRGQGEWLTSTGDRGGPYWQGGIELEANLDRDMALDLGWRRSQRSDSAGVRQWVDAFRLDVNQRRPGNTCYEKRLHLGTSLWEGKLHGLEMAGEALLKPDELWEIWGYGATKMAKAHGIGNIFTHQGILRLARRLKSRLAGFVQIGGWQQPQRSELGYSLGLSCELAQGLHLAAGYTWPIHQSESEGGLLSVKPGVFIQLFAY